MSEYTYIINYGYKGFSIDVPIAWGRLISASEVYLMQEIGSGRYPDLPAIWTWSLQGPTDGRPTLYGDLEILDLGPSLSRITFSGMLDLIADAEDRIRKPTERQYQKIVDGYFSMLEQRFGYTLGETKPVERPRGKSGRPHLPDDEWAWEQIHLARRSTSEIKREWLQRIKADPTRMNNLDLEGQFKRIKKLSWGLDRD